MSSCKCMTGPLNMTIYLNFLVFNFLPCVLLLLIRAAFISVQWWLLFLYLSGFDCFFCPCSEAFSSFIFFSPQLKPWEEPSSSVLGTQSAIWPLNQTEMFSCKTFTLLRVSFYPGTVLTSMYHASHLTDVMCGCHWLTIQTLRYNGFVPKQFCCIMIWAWLIFSAWLISTDEYLLQLVRNWSMPKNAV